VTPPIGILTVASDGSWTNRILPSGRRMIELGATVAGQDAPTMDAVDVTAWPVAVTGNESAMDANGSAPGQRG
jgi:hypothetical protein